jgi:hypothetical protein
MAMPIVKGKRSVDNRIPSRFSFADYIEDTIFY